MVITVYFNNEIFDLTPHVEPKSIQLSLTGDQTMDTGSFTIPDVSEVAFVKLDMSRPLPRLARVRLEDGSNAYDMLVDKDLVLELPSMHRYSHEVRLISPSKLLMDYSTAALTVTQPQGDIALYYRSVSTAPETDYMRQTEGQVLNFTTVSNSLDLEVLNGRQLKAGNKYRISVNSVWTNHQDRLNTHPERNPEDIDCGLIIRFNGESIKSSRFSVKRMKNFLGFGTSVRETPASLTVEFEPEEDGEITVQARQYGGQFYHGFGWTKVKSSDIKIYTSTEETMEHITLDYVVEKALNNEMNEQKFHLDTTSKSLLSRYLSYEWTLPESYLWLQILRIADYIKAYPRVYFEDESPESRLMVEITPFEELTTEQEPPDVDMRQSEATIEDYTSAIEINAKNVFSPEAYLTEVTTLRVEGANAAIQTEGLIIPTQFRIGEVDYISVKVGRQIEVDEETNYSILKFFKLENAVFDKNYYDTLPTESDYSLEGRKTYNQNNTLYYIEGEKNIRGLSNLGGRPTPASWETSQYSRAIYEVVLSQIARDVSVNPPMIDTGKVEDDNLIVVEIRYKPYVETNAVMYKDDQTGFQFKGRKLLNESMAVNNPDIIGSYAQGIANRSGGTKHSVSGVTKPSNLPDVLSKWEDKILFGLHFQMLDDELCEYTAYYIKDYVFISSYESYDKKERIYQVSKDNVIERVIKKNKFIVFSDHFEPEQEIEYKKGVRNFVKHLVNENTSTPKMAYAIATFIDGGVQTPVFLRVSNQTYGRTLEWRVKPKDNYSAGVQKYQSGTRWFQKDYRYTNLFGRSDMLHLKLIDEIPANTLQLRSALNRAPEVSAVLKLRGSVYETSYHLRKDAREIPVISIQYSYISEVDSIIVYDAIGLNAMVVNRSDQFEIATAVLDYKPSRSAKQVDLTKVDTTDTAIATLEGGRILVQTTKKKPVAFYNRNTLDLLLVDTRETNLKEIYFRSDFEITQEELEGLTPDFIIEAERRYDITSEAEEVYSIAFDIEAERDYIITATGTEINSYMFIIEAQREYEINTVGSEYASYSFNIEAERDYIITASAGTMKSYEFPVDATRDYDIKAQGAIQESYLFEIDATRDYQITSERT